VIVGIDTETYKIKPGLLIPPLVCVTFAEQCRPNMILNHYEGADRVEYLLNFGDSFVGHNVAYDMAVLGKERPLMQLAIWQAYDNGRIYDTKLYAQLEAIAQDTLKTSKFHLIDLLGDDAHKGDRETDQYWARFEDEGLREVPISQWDHKLVEIAIKDAEGALKIHLKQQEKPIKDQLVQGRAAYALHLMSARGMRTDPTKVQQLSIRWHSELKRLQEQLIASGLFHKTGTKAEPIWSRDLAAVRARLNRKGVKRTKKGSIATNRVTLSESSDPDLQRLAEYSKVEKLISTYLPVLERGTREDLNVRYGIVESGRTCASNPNIQNMPRSGGIRECFKARGVFVDADYATIELRCVAQIMLTWFRKSALAKAFQDGRDPHMEVAMYLGGPQHRQLGKIANYGIFVGMGARTFVRHAKESGVDLTIRQAREVIDAAFKTWPELSMYLQRAEYGAAVDGYVKHFKSGRIRGNVTSRTVWANSQFQGLAADGAKAALYEVEKAGLEPVAFHHDAILLDSPPDEAEDRASKLTQIMESIMQRYLPDVPVKAEAKILGEYWSK